MSKLSASQIYDRAIQAHRATAHALVKAQEAAEQNDDLLEAATQTYLDALGAPAVGECLPFGDKCMLRVGIRSLDRSTRKNSAPKWQVHGSVNKAKGGEWVHVKFCESMRQPKSALPAPEVRAAQLQALLDASMKRAVSVAKTTLRLGRNELDFLHCMRFDKGNEFKATTGILFGQGGSVRGNVLIAENLRRKGVLVIPNYQARTETSSQQGWYFEPMKKGPRAAEARALMARTPSIYGGR